MTTIIPIDAIRRHHRFQAEEMQRLVKTAQSAGVRIVVTRKQERHIAIDALTPWAYEVDVNGCECARFGICGKCEHHALLLAELGMLDDPEEIGWPEDDDPVTPMAAD